MAFDASKLHSNGLRNGVVIGLGIRGKRMNYNMCSLYINAYICQRHNVFSEQVLVVKHIIKKRLGFRVNPASIA